MNDDPLIPDSLRDELRSLYPAAHKPSPDVDRLIANRARAHLARRNRLRLLLRVGGAAAAVLVLSLILWIQPARQVAASMEDVNADGVVDIRDALALQRFLDAGRAKQRDINHDGVTDRRDVDAIAMIAVRIDGGLQ